VELAPHGVPELGVIDMGVEDRVGEVRFVEQRVGDGLVARAVVVLGQSFNTRHVTVTGMPSAASSVTSG